MIRFRILDPALAISRMTILSLVTTNSPDLYRCEQVFVVENDINGLAFPPVAGGSSSSASDTQSISSWLLTGLDAVNFTIAGDIWMTPASPFSTG